jgi:hypothetical protein
VSRALDFSAHSSLITYPNSYTETDPVAIALAGVTKFRSERFEVIIVDTSGRHRQESELFEEMVQIGQAVEPDMSVLVLDGAIGESLTVLPLAGPSSPLPPNFRPSRRSSVARLQGRFQLRSHHRHQARRSC